MYFCDIANSTGSAHRARGRVESKQNHTNRMKRNISNILAGASCGLCACLALIQPQSAKAMAMHNHINGLGDLGGMADLIGTPASQGGVGPMTRDQLVGVSKWMDDPALKTGQYNNHLAGGKILCPANHNALRHNPVKVAKVWSGKPNSINEDVLNAARTHKIQDIAHNSRPVDGVEITGESSAEAKGILRHVKENGRLPEKLPAWVDERAPLISKSENVGEETASGIGKAGKALVGVGLVASGVQAYEGVQELKHGQTGKGSLNLAGSTANATSAIAGLAGRRLLSGATGAVGAGVDGAIDIYSGIKNNDSEKLSVGGVKSAAAIAMGVGAATGQPEVVVPAAIVYGGAVVTDVAYENREVIGDTVYAASETAKEAAVEGYENTKSKLSTASEITVDTCVNATDAIRGKLNETALTVYDYTPDAVKNNGFFKKSVSWFH